MTNFTVRSTLYCLERPKAPGISTTSDEFRALGCWRTGEPAFTAVFFTNAWSCEGDTLQRTHNAGAPGWGGTGRTDPQRGQTESFMEAWYPADSIVFLSVAAADLRLASKSWAVYKMPLPDL